MLLQAYKGLLPYLRGLGTQWDAPPEKYFAHTNPAAGRSLISWSQPSLGTPVPPPLLPSPFMRPRWLHSHPQGLGPHNSSSY